MDKRMFIPLMVPDITEEDISAAVEVLRSGMLVQGKYVLKLEEAIAEYLGVKHAVAVSSGTASLHIALLALGIGSGDEVIVPAFSFMATANVVEIVGAKPVFVDIDIHSFNIDTKLIEGAITSKTKAIMPVHEFGLACDISEVCRIAHNYNLKVIEDAACSLGATENNIYTGTFGDVGSFSFHPRKAVTSGEGGLLVTNNGQLAEKFRVLRNHGISNASQKIEFVAAGFNYRMTDFQAALVCSQFNRFEAIIEHRSILADTYSERLGYVNDIHIPIVPDNKRHSWQSYHTLTSDFIDRDDLIAKLRERGIGTNYGAQCIPNEIFYKDKYNHLCEIEFPNSFKASRNGLVLPLYGQVTSDDIAFIVQEIRRIVHND